VGVAGDGADVAGEVGWVAGEAEADVTGFAPVLEDAVEWGGENVEREVGEEDDQLEDAAAALKSAVILQVCHEVLHSNIFSSKGDSKSSQS